MDRILEGELKKGKSYCLRLLSLRSRTEQEIETRLKGKGYSQEARKHLLVELKKLSLIDDLKFAKDWIDHRTRTSPRGIRGLKEELKQKGISGNMIEEAMDQSFAKSNEREIALNLVKDMVKGEKDLKLKSKLYGFLLRRGFDGEVAEDVINEVMGE